MEYLKIIDNFKISIKYVYDEKEKYIVDIINKYIENYKDNLKNKNINVYILFIEDRNRYLYYNNSSIYKYIDEYNDSDNNIILSLVISSIKDDYISSFIMVNNHIFLELDEPIIDNTKYNENIYEFKNIIISILNKIR